MFSDSDNAAKIRGPRQITVTTAPKIKIKRSFTVRPFQQSKTLPKKGSRVPKDRQKHPDLWKRNITRIFDDAPTNGETIKEVQERVFRGLDKIKKIYQGKNTLIVTHAFVAKVINKYFNLILNILQTYRYKTSD